MMQTKYTFPMEDSEEDLANGIHHIVRHDHTYCTGDQRDSSMKTAEWILDTGDSVHNQQYSTGSEVTQIDRGQRQRSILKQRLIHPNSDVTFSSVPETSLQAGTHTELQGFKCGLCDQVFVTKTDRNTHMDTHAGSKSYICTVCKYVSLQRTMVESHMLTHTSNCKQILQMRIQKVVVPEKSSSRSSQIESVRRLADHYHSQKNIDIGTYHSRNIGSSSELPIVAPSQQDSTTQSVDHCSRQTDSSTQDLGRDLMIHNRAKRSHCSKQFRHAKSLKTHIMTHTGEKPYKCCDCGKEFTWASVFKKHMRTHTGEKPYKCSDCGKDITGAGHLKTHMMRHTGEKPYKCSECGKQFTMACNLKRHMMTHTGEKPYKCSECGKQFIHASNLKTHMMTHTGEKPHKCSDCGKQFILARSLKTHMMTHTGEKPYKCSECGKQFIHARSLKTHMMTHTGEKPYKCSECGKQFIQASNLKTHMKKHRGEKPHRFSVCGGKKHRESSSRNCYMKSHTGENKNHDKVYNCSQCCILFSTSSELQKHLRTHTRQQPRPNSSPSTKSARPHVNRSHSNQTETGRNSPALSSDTECSQIKSEPGDCVCKEQFDSSSCGTCVRGFTCTGDLQNHVLMHVCSSCDTCVMGFLQVADLQEHVDTHLTSQVHMNVLPHVSSSCDTCQDNVKSECECEDSE